MPVATEADVLAVIDEIGVTYESFGFPDPTAYKDYIEVRWNRVEALINDRIGVANHDEVLFPEQYEGHIYWTVAEVIRRRRIQMLVGDAGGSGGFTIGKYKVDSNAPNVREHMNLYGAYRDLAEEIFSPFIPTEVYGRIGGAIFVPGNEGRTPWASEPSKG